MRQDFNRIIQRAKVDPITAIAVFDNGSFTQVLKPTFGKEIISNHGSIENYLEKLKQDGITNITVQEYRKNGSSIKKVGAPVTVTFGNEKQPVATNMTQVNSLQGIGLGFTEIMNLNTDSVLKTKYETELEFTKRELEETKKQRDELKEEILKMRYDADKGTKNTEAFTSLASIFAPMLQGMMGSGQGALNAPAQNNLSQLKSNLVAIIHNNEFSDDFATLLLNVINKINTQDNFYESLLEIMELNQKK